MIHDGMGLGLVRQWDLLGHVALLLAVEMLLERRLTPPEIIGITTLRGLGQVLDGTFDPASVDAAAVAELSAGDDQVECPVDPSAKVERQDLISMMKYNQLLPGEQDAATRPAMPLEPARRVVTSADLTRALHEAGLEPGDTILLHSDIGAVGITEAGYDRDAVLRFYLSGLLDVLGPAGTLCVCTSFEDYGRYGTPFVREESPSRLGAFSEFVRTRPGAVRSMHPILSITSLGARAEEISGGHHFDGFGYDFALGPPTSAQCQADDAWHGTLRNDRPDLRSLHRALVRRAVSVHEDLPGAGVFRRKARAWAVHDACPVP